MAKKKPSKVYTRVINFDDPHINENEKVYQSIIDGLESNGFVIATQRTVNLEPIQWNNWRGTLSWRKASRPDHDADTAMKPGNSNCGGCAPPTGTELIDVKE